MAVLEKETCKLCGNQQFKLLRDTLRYGVRRDVLECTSCGVVFLADEDTDLNEFYKSDYRTKYGPVLGKEIKSKEVFEIYKDFQQDKIERLQPILGPEKRLLDVGSSAGQFLYNVAPYVREVVGIELNEANVEFVKRNLGFDAFNCPIQEVPLEPESFDIITSFQVLEHIDDPVPFLEAMYRLLKPDGYLCIEVPNIDDVLMKVFGVKSYTDFWYREVHVFNYSAETLEFVLSKAGFTGQIRSVQEYNFLNHMNWVMTGQPQPRPEVGMSAPKLVDDSNPHAELFNGWIQKIDSEYRSMVEKAGLGNHLHFLGKKVQK